MSFRKILFFVLPFLIYSLFWKSLSLAGMGAFAKGYLLWQKGWDLEYQKIERVEGGIVLSDCLLREKKGFSLQAPKVVVFFRKKHIEIEQPTIVLWAIPQWQGSGAWTFALRRGQLENGSTFSVTTSREKGVLQIEAEVEKFDLAFFRPWLEEEIQGLVRGKLHFSLEKGQWKRGKGHLEGEKIRWRIFDGVAGSGDWEGPLHWQLPQEGWLRLVLSEGTLRFPQKDIKGIRGILSIVGGTGAKWEFAGEGAQWRGRTFFHSLKEPWVESELLVGTSLFSLKGSGNGFQVRGAIAGVCQGELFLEGKWREGKLHFGVSRGSLDAFCFGGKGWLDPHGSFFWQSDTFHGPLESLYKWLGKEAPLQGDLCAREKGFIAFGDLSSQDWSFEGRIEKGSLPLFAGMEGKDVEMEIEASPKQVSCYAVSGTLSCRPKWRFYCPIVQTNGAFDIRLAGETRDFLRLAGVLEGKKIVFDEKKSHCLGSSFSLSQGVLSDAGIEQCAFDFELSWESAFSFVPARFVAAPLSGKSALHCSYEKGKGISIQLQGTSLQWKGEPISFVCHLVQEGENWEFREGRIADFHFAGTVQPNCEMGKLFQGTVEWKNKGSAAFEGRFDSLQKGSIRFSHVQMNGSAVDFFFSSIGEGGRPQAEGSLEGSGCLSWDGKWEADFDLTASRLQVGEMSLENRTPLHLYYSSEKGLFFRGLDFQIFKSGLESPWLDCKIGFLQYDIERSLWIFTQSHFHLPQDFFSRWEEVPSFLKQFSFEAPIDFVADIEYSHSSFSCSIQEGFFPWGGAVRHVRDFFFSWNPRKAYAQTHLLDQGREVKLSCDCILEEPQISGRFVFEERFLEERPLAIDWVYREGQGLEIQAIEGVFGGIDASFHAEGEALIGSARLNFTLLSEIVPQRIAAIFRDLKMGKGYQLMGRLRKGSGGIAFEGIFSGKQFELFGYQLRTLLAQIRIEPGKVRIYDIKISDLAGVMKIDEIAVEGKEDRPWTIAMPHLSITELRPSLLQKIGQGAEPISPLVVRELKLDNFQGLLEDGKTYTAKGELHFINSYKRGRSLLDIPSDVLSRIVGLDFDLLIPVCGALHYELKDGLFHLTELQSAYSEHQRSEFFLIKNENSPTMDLDGNLHILVKMKQFVLFKFTEAFLISIEGKLDDPKFHLQKKRRFLGL